MKESYMRYVCLTVASILCGCGDDKQQPQAALSQDQEQKSRGTTLPEELIRGYENLDWFLQEDSVGKMFDDLLASVHADLKRQIDMSGEKGFEMNGALLKQPGQGILSNNREGDEPASVLVQRHRLDVPEVTISKPTRWDEITLNGEKYARVCTRELYLQGDSEGLTHFTLSVEVRATPISLVEIARRSGAFEYCLSSRYELSSQYSQEELKDSGSTIIFHYDPTKEVEKDTGVRLN
jgi:hypothetical protein